MNLRTIFVIAQKEVQDAKRNKWFVIISALFATLALALSFLGLSGLGSVGVAGFGRTTASLLNLVFLIVPLMGLLLGAMSVAAEREQGTLVTLLAQPVTAGEILLGKFLGTAMAVATMLLLGFGLSGLVMSWYGGLSQLGGYLVLVSFTILLGLANLSVGFLISIFLKKNTAAVGFALLFWFVFLFLSDLGLMGVTVALKLPYQILFWVACLNPPQAFKLAVIGTLHGGLDIFGAAGRYALDVFGNWFLGFLTLLLVCWVIIPLGSALFLFQKKCAE